MFLTKNDVFSYAICAYINEDLFYILKHRGILGVGCMKNNEVINFKKSRSGPELDLVDAFLSSYQRIFDFEGYEVSTLIEPYINGSNPDILFIIWDSNLCRYWKPERNDLSKDDIKINHYISTFGKRGVLKQKISESINYTDSFVQRSLYRLDHAGLIKYRNGRAVSYDLDKSFFIKKIISVEAKIANWKEAVQQALLNQNFASHSYVLLPYEKINSSIEEAFDKNIGLLGFNSNRTVLRKKARKSKIPGSYYSWILNEHLGRKCYNEYC